jgi:type IV secretory pathway VirB10-like protein
MNEDPKVQLTKEPGVKGQFGKSRMSYQAGGTKARGPVVAGSCIVLTIAVSAVVLTGSPKKDPSDQASHFLGVEVPQTVTGTPEMLSIPSAHSGDSQLKKPGKSTGGGVPVKFSGPQVVSRPRNILIPPGSMVKAVLISGASDGPVKAEIKEPLMVGGETLLEVGTILMGTGRSGTDRLVIQFKKAVFRDGTSAPIDAEAADGDDKIPGIKGSRIGYRAAKLGASIGLEFVGGMSQALQDTQGQSGAVVTTPTVKNALLNGAARASIDQGQEMMNEYRNQKPVFEVSAGTVVYVLFSDSDSK